MVFRFRPESPSIAGFAHPLCNQPPGLQPFPGHRGQRSQIGVAMRVRLNIAAVIDLISETAAHFRVKLFGIEDGVMLQFGQLPRKVFKLLRAQALPSIKLG